MTARSRHATSRTAPMRCIDPGPCQMLIAGDVYDVEQDDRRDIAEVTRNGRHVCYAFRKRFEAL